MSALTAPGFYPFTIAALILVGLVVFEIVAVLVGLSFTTLLSHGHADHGGADGHGDHGPLAAWMSWLNKGGVPLLVLIMIALASFAISGFLIQGVANSLIAPLPTLLASLCAIAAAMPVTRTLSRWTAKLLPSDETAAISQADLIGLVGTVALGPLDQGKPGSVRVRDRHGNIHVLRANAAPGHTIPQGVSVLLVDGNRGLFQAIPAPKELDAGSGSDTGR